MENSALENLKYALPRIIEVELAKRRLTQTELARLCGVSKTVLNGWLAGSAPRDLLAVARMADALKMPLYFILFGEKDPHHAGFESN